MAFTKKGVKRLDKKPVMEFTDAQFLTILKAEKENFITVKIFQDAEEEEEMLNSLKVYYLSDGHSLNTRLWNEQREQILKCAVLDHLSPVFNGEIRDKLKWEADQRIIKQCGRLLMDRLMVAPVPKPRRLYTDRESQMQVMGCVWGPGLEKTQIAVVNENGELVEYLQLSYVNNGAGPRATAQDRDRRNRDLDKIYELILRVRPAAIVLGASPGQINSRRFFEDLRALSGEASRSLKEEPGSMPVEFVVSDVARIYANSPRANSEFKELNGNLRQAISLGRMVLDPLTEMSGLCTSDKEILCLKLHQLQECVNQEQLMACYTRCFMDVVGQVGVDINKAMQFSWAAAPVQFVSGLGPRKAAWLLQTLPRNKAVSSRDQIDDILPREQNAGTARVYVNCAAFLRIKSSYLILFESEEEYNALDDTRVHPDSYAFARKMAADALDATEEDERFDLIEEIMDNPAKLDRIDLDSFAEEWERRNGENKSHTLYQIKGELQRPFAEVRRPFVPLSAHHLFFTLTGESKGTLCRGQLVTLRIVRLLRDKVLGRLDNGLQGVITLDYLSDRHVYSADEVVAIGQNVSCRILEINMDTFEVALSTRGSDLADNSLYYFEGDRYLIDDTLTLSTQMEKPKNSNNKNKKKGGKTYLTRHIKHPLFHAVSYQDAEQLLKDKEAAIEDAVIIRPSSKGWDHLTVTWKFYHGVFIHTDVVEKEKAHYTSLGKQLYVDNDQYEDLDEIIVRYISPMLQYCQDMFHFRYFRGEDKDATFQRLKEAKEADPARIPYFIGVSKKLLGKFILCSLPGKNPKCEYISVTPEGFRFRQQQFQDVERLIRWFKAHFNDPVPRSSRHSRHRPV